MEDSEQTVKTAIVKVHVPSDAVNGSVVSEPKIEKNGTVTDNIHKDSLIKPRNGKKRYKKYPKKNHLSGKKETLNGNSIIDQKSTDNRHSAENEQSANQQSADQQSADQQSADQQSADQQSVHQQKKETTHDQKPQNKKYYRKSGNQRRFSQRDNRQNPQSQQLNLPGKTVSVVVPLYNEEDSLVELSVALKKVLDNLRCTWEVIFVDDGSNDGSYGKLQEIHKINSRFKCLKFKRNYGKSAALQEGFKAAKGDYVITMDADLQDDPDEIPAMIAKLNEGFDLVSGWKKVRHDPFIKKHTSKLFNKVTSMMVGLKLHDYNCGLKAYVSDVVKNVKVYGEMHRYIPALAHLSGFRVTEMPVTHHERKYGKTKYGISRFFNGLFDLITVLFTTKYIKRPLHLFGFFGVLSFISGTGILIYLTVLKFFDATPISGRPLFFVGILMAIVGVQFFSIGLIGEMITKNSIENDNVIIDKTLG